EIAESEAQRLDLVALIHHPLGEETGLEPATAEALRHGERRALAAACGVIATSTATARLLINDYGVNPERIAVARPGSDLSTRAGDGRRGDAVELLSVGTLTHRKGHDLLVEALARLRDLPWLCRIVGSPDRAPAVAAALECQIARHGLH